MPDMLKHSDICLSVRTIDKERTVDAALALMRELRPTRIEWSYVTDREFIARFKEIAPTFVASLNTISPRGRAESFVGEPIVAPWMTRFGQPDNRATYICQNNPEDFRARVDKATALIADGTTDSFQFDDWFCNAQMLNFGNPCFCEFCMREFRTDLGLDIDYRAYLRTRGFTHTAGILDAAKQGKVPLWDDYRRFQERTVTRFFRRLKTAMDRALAAPVSLSVNGSVLNFGGNLDTVIEFLSYCHGETWDFAPPELLKLAEASRRMGLKQIVSLFPGVPVADYHDPSFVGLVRQAIGLCYCLGLLPLFPYDVYAGNEPDGSLKSRWFGTWEEYRAPYEIVRSHPEWFDEYAYTSCEIGDDGVVSVVSRWSGDEDKRLLHRIAPDGEWTTEITDA